MYIFSERGDQELSETVSIIFISHFWTILQYPEVFRVFSGIEYMKEISRKNKIKTQLEILPAGGTDTAGIQRMNPGGCIAGAVSIPTRHIHQVIEMVHKEDVRAAIDLLKTSVENLNNYNWGFK